MEMNLKKKKIMLKQLVINRVKISSDKSPKFISYLERNKTLENNYYFIN